MIESVLGVELSRPLSGTSLVNGDINNDRKLSIFENSNWTTLLRFLLCIQCSRVLLCMSFYPF